MDYDKLIEQLNAWNEQHLYVVCGGKHFACDYLCENEECIVVRAATAIETLRDENEKIKENKNRAIESLSRIIKLAYEQRDTAVADLARVTAERDAAVKAVKNMAEYIVCAGRVDCFLCDEISQEHHLKYQPKNDGNYDNEPCYKCIADWFLQGHEWQENC